jgi:hypothetical protein
MPSLGGSKVSLHPDGLQFSELSRWALVVYLDEGMGLVVFIYIKEMER